MGLPTYDTLPFPYEATPSSLAIKPTSPNINGFLTVGDCVALSPFDETILSKGSGVFPLQFTCGRIIDVRHSLASVCGTLHPLVFADNTAKNLGSPGFRIQLYFGPGTGSSKNPLPELIESNISVWVSYRHIDKIIIILHDNDVTRHTYGSLSGRRNHFIVRDRQFFPDFAPCTSAVPPTTASTSPVPHNTYNTFGPHTNDSNVEIFSERMFHGLNGLMEQSIKLFCANRKITKLRNHAEQQQSKEFFRYFSNSISGGGEDESGVVHKVRKCLRVKRVLQPGLVLLSRRYKTRGELLYVVTPKGYATIRQVLSVSCLAGPKKRWPPTERKESNCKLSNIPLFLNRDTVRCVDVLPFEASNASINKVQYFWDPVTRKCKSTFEASEVQTNAGSEDFLKIATSLNLVPILEGTGLMSDNTDKELLSEVGSMFFKGRIGYVIKSIDTINNTLVAIPYGGSGEEKQFCLIAVEIILHTMLK